MWDAVKAGVKGKFRASNTYVCVCIYIYIYIYTHTHTYGTAERSYPTSEVRGGSLEELPHAPKPEARGGGWEEQPHVQGTVAAWAQEGLEELFHIEGQEGRG